MPSASPISSSGWTVHHLSSKSRTSRGEVWIGTHSKLITKPSSRTPKSSKSQSRPVSLKRRLINSTWPCSQRQPASRAGASREAHTAWTSSSRRARSWRATQLPHRASSKLQLTCLPTTIRCRSTASNIPCLWAIRDRISSHWARYSATVRLIKRHLSLRLTRPWVRGRTGSCITRGCESRIRIKRMKSSHFLKMVSITSQFQCRLAECHQ